MSDTPVVDLVAYLKALKGERYRAVVVLGAPMSGKTKFAKRLAEVTGAGYVDVLDAFESDPTVEPNGPNDQIQRIALANAGESGIVILDNVDFWLNARSDEDRRDFGRWLGKRDDVQLPPVVCVFAQHDRAFDGLELTKTMAGLPRVLDLTRLQNI